ncbi:SPOSA6832_02287 [Sporobolomyces salmonicolor]|uniref:SPOSA6832_02287-mRNA-1:cds n=1 Tax=Sporidiobolus salmonicolor TaxID=5005 RepID=A0A0D6ELR9_SPOSA|nr:SPOSA6832_02287 [Sporobolomyces salmonicolor]
MTRYLSGEHHAQRHARSTPPHVCQTAPPSPTAVFYRALVPSILHCLALGSIVYYALELSYMWLRREKDAEDLGARVAELERELEEARKGRETGGVSAGERTARRGSWWRLW